MANKLDEILKKYGFEDEIALFEHLKNNGAVMLAVNEVFKNYRVQNNCTNKVLLKSQELLEGYTLVLVAMISDDNEIESYVVGRRYKEFEKSAFIDYYEQGHHFYSLDDALQYFNNHVKSKGKKT